MNKTFGMLLIVVGLLGLVLGGVSYTTSEKLVDIGPIHATHDTTHTMPWAPIAGVVALAAGIVMVVVDRKRLA